MEENNIFEAKEQLRRRMKERAAALTPEEKSEKDLAVLRELASLPEMRSAATVFCYVSVGSEVDTRKLIPVLLHGGRRVFVPRVDGAEMSAVEITSPDDLSETNAFGIPEPPASFPAADPDGIDIALIPGAAFGTDGSRLGRGMGYYDRWLAGYHGTKCGIAREDALLETVPSENTDERMNVVVSDRCVCRVSTAQNTIESAIEQNIARSVARAEEEPDDAAEEELPAEPELPEEDEEPETRPRKRRLGCFGALIWFLCVIGISAALAGFGWMCADDLLGLTAEDSDATITVLETDDVSAVADKLAEAGMIKRPWLFEIFGKIFDAEEKISPGVYNVNAIMDYRALINAMRENSSYRATVDVTIPEGYTVEQILRRLEENGVASYEDLADVCANYDFEYSFLEDIPLGDVNRLEGYLFPNSHTFYVDENPVNAINRFLNDFSNKFDEDLRAEAEEMGMSVHDVLTLASMIEKEAASTSEMPLISSVIHNRLDNWPEPYLQIDATIQYVLEERKQYLSLEDLAIDSPYNTYKYMGLPPGPICNPGLAAIRAALRPEETDNYYYALTEEGTHEFVRTSEELQAIINANPGAYGAE